MRSTAKEPREQQQYLTFLLADEEFAISILKVKEIIEYDTVTKVPKTPKWIRGVINLRGGVVPVVDLAVKFGLEDRPVTKTTCIIIVESQLEEESMTMGVVADSVSQVMELAVEEIQRVPEFGTRVKVDYLLGMAQLGKKFALLLDVDKVLSTDEQLNIGSLAAGADRNQYNGSDSALPLPAGPGMSGEHQSQKEGKGDRPEKSPAQATSA